MYVYIHVCMYVWTYAWMYILNVDAFEHKCCNSGVARPKAQETRAETQASEFRIQEPRPANARIGRVESTNTHTHTHMRTFQGLVFHLSQL